MQRLAFSPFTLKNVNLGNRLERGVFEQGGVLRAWIQDDTRLAVAADPDSARLCGGQGFWIASSDSSGSGFGSLGFRMRRAIIRHVFSEKRRSGKQGKHGPEVGS